MSIRSFLTNLKYKVDSNSLSNPIKFVTGNQSADLDSVISAICYSYFLNINDSSYVIPIINIPRDHFKLRRDIIHLLDIHSINESLLYFVEDFNSLSERSKKASLILVDHCNIQGEAMKDAFAKGKIDVVSIIDHHQDENVFSNADPRIIKTSGSCSSQVFNYWYNIIREKEGTLTKELSELAQLLLGPLLIDTSKMTLKVENADLLAFDTYKRILLNKESQKSEYTAFSNSNELDVFFDKFYKDLKGQKKNLDGFSFLDILYKDYKQFIFGEDIKVGFSSVGKSSKWILKTFDTSELQQSLTQITSELNLDLLIFTTSYTDKKTDIYTREFCYYYKRDNKNSALFAKLSDLATDDLSLTPQSYTKKDISTKISELNSNESILKVFNQRNTAASRKQIVPVVKRILDSK